MGPTVFFVQRERNIWNVGPQFHLSLQEPNFNENCYIYCTIQCTKLILISGCYKNYCENRLCVAAILITFMAVEITVLKLTFSHTYIPTRPIRLTKALSIICIAISTFLRCVYAVCSSPNKCLYKVTAHEINKELLLVWWCLLWCTLKVYCILVGDVGLIVIIHRIIRMLL